MATMTLHAIMKPVYDQTCPIAAMEELCVTKKLAFSFDTSLRRSIEGS
jgi:hypothetical protein